MFQYLEDNQLFKSGEINDDETNSIECRSHIWMSDKQAQEACPGAKVNFVNEEEKSTGKSPKSEPEKAGPIFSVIDQLDSQQSRFDMSYHQGK